MAQACSPVRSCRSRLRLLPSKRSARPFAMDSFPLLPLEEEGRLNDLPLRQNFIERVLPVANRRDRAYGGTAAVPLGSVAQAHCTTAWTEMLDDEPTPGGLVPVPAVRAGKFHTAQKLTREAGTGLLRAMAHSPS
jgi:hypothetical protein